VKEVRYEWERFRRRRADRRSGHLFLAFDRRQCAQAYVIRGDPSAQHIARLDHPRLDRFARLVAYGQYPAKFSALGPTGAASWRASDGARPRYPCRDPLVYSVRWGTNIVTCAPPALNDDGRRGAFAQAPGDAGCSDAR